MADKFQLKALITGVDKLSPVLTGVRKNVSILRKQVNSSGLGKITFGDAIQGGALAAPFVMGVQAAIGFESAMADVKKVVNFDTPAQFKQMGEDVLDLSERLPMAAEGIASIVAAGGQSGFAREELNQFAEDAVKMGVAFDQTAAQSGEMMAKWRTAFHLNQAEVVTLADKINYLGNTGAASTAQISAIVTAIGPLGEVAGVNAGQLAAMGSALAGVGIAQDVAATGIKNFMLTLTAGTAATKAQKEAYKALRLDSNQIAEGMQTDSEGTIERVLKTLAKVEKSKQAAVLTQLFGKESVGAIAPLLTNLDTLQKNFKSVGKEGEFAGSMQAEYQSRSETTANALQLLNNRVTRLGISVGSMLLPPFNDFMATVGPLISDVTALASAHPWLIKGILGAAVGFTVLRLAAAGATFALTLLNGVAGMSPVGLIVRGIALAAGILLANWSTVGPYFAKVWEMIRAPAMATWGWMKTAFNWSPLGQIVANWGPISELFGAVWGLVKALSVPFVSFLKTLFNWSPLGQIVANWGAISELFGAVWQAVKAQSVPFTDFMRTLFDWSPLGMVVKHWEPITQFFGDLWARLKPIVEPMMKFLGFEASGDGLIKSATDKVKGWTEQQQARNEQGLPTPGQLVKPVAAMPELIPGAASAANLLRAPANDAVAPGLLLRPPAPQLVVAQSAAVPSMTLPPRLPDDRGQPVAARSLAEAAPPAPLRLPAALAQSTLPRAPAPGTLPAARNAMIQQSASAQRTSLEGSMVVRFENAPPGMRVDPAQTNQPGLSVTPAVGYRSIGRGTG